MSAQQASSVGHTRKAVDSASLLTLVVVQSVEFFDLGSLTALTAANQQLKHDLDSEWAWYHRCVKAGYVKKKAGGKKKFLIDWKQLFRSNSQISAKTRNFQVAVDLDDVVIKCPVPSSLAARNWHSEIKSKIFRLTGEGVHIHHDPPTANGAIGNFFLPSETAAFLRVLSCDCRGVCQVPKKFPITPTTFRLSVSEGRLALPPLPGPLQTVFLPRSEISTCTALVSKLLGKNISPQTEISVHHPGGAVRDGVGNLRMREDFRLIEGEILKVEHSVIGNCDRVRIRREFLNENDALTHEGSQREWESELPSFIEDKPKLFTSASPRILLSSRDARQFEFNPLDRKLLLVGRKSGSVALLDCEKDIVRSEISVDTSPIIGLTWLNRRPNVAVFGASLSGDIGLVKFDSVDAVEKSVIGNFPQLSSVSVNCTDDLLMASGFTRDVSLFDVHTGTKIGNFQDVHDNFINILRFSHSMPHVYSTCSFDASVKLWDLRAQSTRPTACFRSPSLNVMCCFSPDDRKLLVSGMDDNVYQLSVQQGLRDLNIPHNIVRRNSHTNYRRSVFLSGAEIFATAGTDESTVRLINSSSGACCGELDFTGTLARLNGASEFDINGDLRSPARLFGNLVSRLLMLGRRRANIVGGAVEDFEEVPRVYGEYVQSLRTHPVEPRKLGVLLSPYERNADSVIAIADLASTSSYPAPALHAQGL